MFKAKKSARAASNKPQIRKRHWALGSMIILGGSWITHTTTATITSTSIPTADASANAELTLRLPEPELTDSLGLLNQTNDDQTIVIPPVGVDEVIAPAPEEVFTSVRHTIKKGESLGIIFRKQSLSSSLPHFISQHPVAKKLVSISVGKEIEFKFDSSKNLRQISYPLTALKQLDVVIENDELISASVESLPYLTKQKTVSSEISSSLYLSALDAGLSNNLIMEMIRIFGWDIDFVLDIRRGDSFHVIYTEYHLGGKKLSDGDILAAEFTTQGQTYRAIRFEDGEGNASFYTPEGKSMLGTFLRSPVEFSRISSRFGKRKHPISKKWKAHKGVDYAASRGTPIRATADGKVSLAGRKGGYGNTVILRHAGTFTTLYAHMKGFAKGVRSGARVKQGQVIGYVGTTGYSTGPHLHYEFRVNSVHRNPLTYKTPKASSVGKELKVEFDTLANNWASKLDSMQSTYQLANIKSEGSSL